MTPINPPASSEANEETRQAWDANAAFWDEKMGEGNDFVNLLEWPAMLRLLDPQPGQHMLDIATGNGLTARRLAALGVQVSAFDFSEELIKFAQTRTGAGLPIKYYVLDATDESNLLDRLAAAAPFDSALCNMALFDMADIEPLFHALPKLLKPGGGLVFSLCHPAFNNTSSVHMAEETDVEGQIRLVHSIKVSQYMTPHMHHGAALRGQPRPQTLLRAAAAILFQPGLPERFRAGRLRGMRFSARAAPNQSAQLGRQLQRNPAGAGGAPAPTRRKGGMIRNLY